VDTVEGRSAEWGFLGASAVGFGWGSQVDIELPDSAGMEQLIGSWVMS
jgi:hypothetical protein